MPAAAVIPAPIAYIKVVAVKKFVVECLGPVAVDLCVCTSGPASILARARAGGNPSRALPLASITVNKLECLKRAGLLEYISME